MTPAQDETALDSLVPMDQLRERGEAGLDWLLATLLDFDIALQTGLVVAALLPALIFGPRLRDLIRSQLGPRLPKGLPTRLVYAFGALATPRALLAVISLIWVGLGSFERPRVIVEAAMSLLTAWTIIRAVTLVIRSKFWSAVAFYTAWPVAALDVFGLLDDVVMQLQAFAIPLGETPEGEPVDLSLFDVLRTLIYFGVLFWLASFAGRTINSKLEKTDELSPALRALIGKIIGIALPVVAFLVALQMTGFNLATLAIFSGAIGLGIGLGLQQTVSNFAAGFTLLADESIKPGDAIEVDGTFGWVTDMRARYVAIRTRDGTELLIPNENFIVNGVVNWSKSDQEVRLHAPFGVSYGTKDLREVQRVVVEAAKRVDRVIASPAPACNLMEYGDSSVNFDLRFWIIDPSSGLSNVRSEVYLAIWDALHEAGVEFPFPQMDVHVKEMPGQLPADTSS